MNILLERVAKELKQKIANPQCGIVIILTDIDSDDFLTITNLEDRPTLELMVGAAQQFHQDNIEVTESFPVFVNKIINIIN